MTFHHLTFLLFLLIPLTTSTQHRFLTEETGFISTSGNIVLGKNTSSQGIAAVYGTKKGTEFGLLLSRLTQSDDERLIQGVGVV